MANILPVSASSLFSVSPVDANVSAPEELDPRFVEELQGALGQPESPAAPPVAPEDKSSPAPLEVNSDTASGLQNLPLMPWVAMTMPANFAPAEVPLVGAVGAVGVTVSVEAVVGPQALTLNPASMGSQAPVATSEDLMATGMDTPDPATSRAMTPPMSVPPVSGGVTTGANAAATGPAAHSTNPAPSITELMQPNSVMETAGPLGIAPTSHVVEHSTGPNLTSAGATGPASPLQAQPVVHLAQGTTAPAQSLEGAQPASDAAPSPGLLSPRDEATEPWLQTQPHGLALPDEQASVATRVELASPHSASAPGPSPIPSAGEPVNLLPTMSPDKGAEVPATATNASATTMPLPVEASQAVVPVGTPPHEGLGAQEGPDAAPFFSAQQADAGRPLSSVAAPVASDTPVVATPSQVLTVSTAASTPAVVVPALGNSAAPSLHTSSRRDEASDGADPAAQVSTGVTADTTMPTRGVVVTDTVTTAQAASSQAEQAEQAAQQASAATAQGRVRSDSSASESRAEVSLSAGSEDAVMARVVSNAAQNAWRMGATEATTQDLRSAESTFASSFVQALMGQVHHGNAQHVQLLEVVPSPAPMAPHEVRFDAGQVQVEVVRLVKQGGGQVVMELTPPDESKFKIDLTISQQGVARLVVDGASESTRLRLEQTVSGLQDQFQQMGLQLQLDMRQPHQQQARSQEPFLTPEAGDINPRAPSLDLAEAQALNGRPTWEQGQVYLVA